MKIKIRSKIMIFILKFHHESYKLLEFYKIISIDFFGYTLRQIYNIYNFTINLLKDSVLVNIN